MTATEQQGSTGTVASIFAGVRESYRQRRATRAIYKAAQQELAAYTTAADLQELDAIMERSDTPSVYTEVLEEIRLRAA